VASDIEYGHAIVHVRTVWLYCDVCTWSVICCTPSPDLSAVRGIGISLYPAWDPFPLFMWGVVFCLRILLWTYAVCKRGEFSATLRIDHFDHFKFHHVALQYGQKQCAKLWTDYKEVCKASNYNITSPCMTLELHIQHAPLAETIEAVGVFSAAAWGLACINDRGCPEVCLDPSGYSSSYNGMAVHMLNWSETDLTVWSSIINAAQIANALVSCACAVTFETW